MTYDYLINLRKKNALQQAYVATHLEMTRQTYAQIEKGDRDLTVKEAEKLAKLYDLSLTDFIQGRNPKEQEVTIQKVSEKKEMIAVPGDKVEKFKQVLLYVLKEIGARPNIGETALYKILYFIDFDYFEEFREKLVGATYIKNIHGPTPVEFKKIMEEMLKMDQLEMVKSKYFQYDQRKYLPKTEPNLKIINAREIKFIDSELERLAEKNGRDLSEYSHGDAPWLLTEEGKVIDYKLVWERTKPYTRHNYEQEFMQAGASDVLKDLGPINQEEYDYYQSFKRQ